MNNTFEKYFYTLWLSETLAWFKSDLEFYRNLKKPEVKELYKPHIEWQLLEIQSLKNKIKNI